jgi:hypothetical protein
MLKFSALSKGRGVGAEQQAFPTWQVHLLVAHCTTSLQTQTSANQKIQFAAKPVGCGCAKAIFPTTSTQKKKKESFCFLYF